MQAKRQSKPYPGCEINPLQVAVEGLILIKIGEFTDEDDRFLRETYAQTLQLGDEYFDNDFPHSLAGELSIPQEILESLPDMWNVARSKDPAFSPHDFAAENARLNLEVSL